MTFEELKKLQNTQYEIFEDMVALCDKYAIKYYLAYGTLLGAVRHKGSIPWDYDIDIFMDRKNHDKFMRVAGELPDIYETRKVGESQYNGLTRVYKKNTLIYSEEYGKKDAFPIHVDIFVLEYAKKQKIFVKRIMDILAKYLMIAKLNKYEKRWIYKRFERNKIKMLVVRSGELLKFFFTEGQIEKWIYKMLVSEKKESEYVVVQDLKKRFPVECFEEGILLEYEKGKYFSPKKYKQLLEKCYGDYMQFPPEDKRFTAEMDDLIIVF